MSRKDVIQENTFQSSSDASLRYTTLTYADGTMSCNCPGWTRRVAADGSRECKHTRTVQLENERGAKRVKPAPLPLKELPKPKASVPPRRATETAKQEPEQPTTTRIRRVFQFEED